MSKERREYFLFSDHGTVGRALSGRMCAKSQQLGDRCNFSQHELSQVVWHTAQAQSVAATIINVAAIVGELTGAQEGVSRASVPSYKRGIP